MRKLSSIIIAFALTTMVAIPALANTTLNLNYNNYPLQLENELISKENRVLLPLRELSETFGYDVNWNQALKTITVSKKDKKVVLTMGEKEALVNNKLYMMETAPSFHQDATYVPLRFVAEAFDMKVNWDSKNQMVTILGKTIYAVDQEHYQILALTPKGKEVLTHIENSGLRQYDIALESHKTANGNDILITTEIYSGAITRAIYNIYYINSGKLIKQAVEESDLYEVDKVQYLDNLIGMCDGKTAFIYDDQTGQLVAEYDIQKILNGEASDSYVLEVTAKDFLLVRKNEMEGGGMLTLIDLTTNKVQPLYALIRDEKEREYAQWKSLPTHDGIYLTSKGGKTLTFKYFDMNNQGQTLQYELGK